MAGKTAGAQALLPGLLGQLLQHRAQFARSGDALRKGQPQGIRAVLQFDAVGIETGAAPVAGRRAVSRSEAVRSPYSTAPI